MKAIFFLSAWLVLVTACKPQQTEFATYDNGLIYDASTLNRLRHIVDSLNFRFRACDVKNYISLPQGHATYFHLTSGIKQAKEAIRNQVTPEVFEKTFAHASVRKREWIIKRPYTNYENKKCVKYFSLPLRKTDNLEISLPMKPSNDKVSGWIYLEQNGELNALYLGQLTSFPLPPEYAKLVHYVDCMIDTSARIYFPSPAEKAQSDLPADSKISQFLSWANDFPREPHRPDIAWDSPFAETQYNKYEREHKQWDQARLAHLDEKIDKGHFYKSLLMDAAREAIDRHASNDDLEFYVERYLSPALALEMKRGRQPTGFCSMDLTPRIHAAHICRLAAKTAQWDIFLRAHLDIMNDNFQRNSDGSWAWESRGTYLKELEELDIQVIDLLLGTCLRPAHVDAGHYLGDIGRIGRALSETSDGHALEERMITMIQDERLDLFNRMMMVYLFDNYKHHLEDGEQKTQSNLNFKRALDSLPGYIQKTLE